MGNDPPIRNPRLTPRAAPPRDSQGIWFNQGITEQSLEENPGHRQSSTHRNSQDDPGESEPEDYCRVNGAIRDPE